MATVLPPVFGQLDTAVDALPADYPGKAGYTAWIADAKAKYTSPPPDVDTYITGLKAAGTALRAKGDVAAPEPATAPVPAAIPVAAPAATAEAASEAAPVAATEASAAPASADAADEAAASLLPSGPDQNVALVGSNAGETEPLPGEPVTATAAAEQSGEANRGENELGGRRRRSSRKTRHHTPKRKKLSKKKTGSRK
jgi:hypothetical protein